MIAEIFASLLLAISFLLMGWQIYSLGYDNGERAGRKQIKSEKAEPASDN